MEMLAMAVIGLIIGVATDEFGAALALAALGALFVKLKQLQQQVTTLQARLDGGTQAKPSTPPQSKATVVAEQRHLASSTTAGAQSEKTHQPTTTAAAVAPATSPEPSLSSNDPYVRPQGASHTAPVTMAPTLAPTDSASEPSVSNTVAPAISRANSATTQHSESVATRWSNSALGRMVAKTNMITRVGIIILFLGVSFLLKYAAESVSVPIELRLTGIAFSALIVFVLGWRLRHTRRDYALLLQGAAVGTGYLVTFASMKIYAVLPPSQGFFLLFGLSVFAALMSVKQDAKSLAVFGILGGFLAPILASTGGGSHIMLFSYYALLNAGIVAIVWFKAWRVLTLMGFAFTFVIGVAWGVTRYKAELFASTEPFLLLFILFYIAVAMIFALRKNWAPHTLIDGPLVFGTPVIGFTLQALLVRNDEYGLAWSALGFGVFYLTITTLWWRMMSARAPLLRESFLAIGVVFVSLSIPFAFDHDVTALAWALEGGGALWLAVRQQRNWGVLLSLVAQGGAGLFWLIDSPAAGETLFLNAGYLSALIISLVGMYGAWLLRDIATNLWCRHFHLPLLSWSLLWWFATALWQFYEHFPHAQLLTATLIFSSLSCIVFAALRARYQWTALTAVTLALLPLGLLAMLVNPHFVTHPFAAAGYFAWPLLWASLYGIYQRGNVFSGAASGLKLPAHFCTYIMIIVVLCWEAAWQIDQITYLSTWLLIGPALVLFAGIQVAQRATFSDASIRQLYQSHIVNLLSCVIAVAVLFGCFVQPNVSPMPYFPLLNVLDLWQISMLTALLFWWRRQSEQSELKLPTNFGWGILAALCFMYLNTLLLRTLHVVTHIPFNAHALFRDDLVQTSLSIFWTLIGMALFVAANRFKRREPWMVGMGLFAVVVAKLFVIDLANSGTVERIISFIVVGLLLLAVGYLMPLPDRDGAASEEGKENKGANAE